MVADRVYAARRIAPGLYVQPSNDGSRLFAVTRYEDGRCHGLEHGPWRATFWAWGDVTDQADRITSLARYDEAQAEGELRDWAMNNTGYATKREAVAAALASTHESD